MVLYPRVQSANAHIDIVDHIKVFEHRDTDIDDEDIILTEKRKSNKQKKFSKRKCKPIDTINSFRYNFVQN